MARKSWQQELEAAGHEISAVKERLINIVFFFLFSSRPQLNKSSRK